MGEDKKDARGLTEREFIQQYDVTRFERPSVTVDILLFTVSDNEPLNYRRLPEKELQVLMIRRGEHPCLGQWALPGGFVGMTESLDEAATRELYSETNVNDVYLEQLYTWGEPGRDPRTRVISSSYMALIDSSSLEIRAGDDAADARWFTIMRKTIEQTKTLTPEGYIYREMGELRMTSGIEVITAKLEMEKTVTRRSSQVSFRVVESDGIAFDHAKIIEYGMARLRNKLEYTDIAFSLMPEEFTLTELQQVYEVILDKELLKANFRRKIAPMVRETDRQTQDDGHRPAKFFRFNPEWNKEEGE